MEWSDEDECYIGRCPELFIGGVHGPDRSAVYDQLCGLIDEWIEILKKDGEQLPPSLNSTKQFSGKFVLRCTSDQHRLLALRTLGIV